MVPLFCFLELEFDALKYALAVGDFSDSMVLRELLFVPFQEIV
jgi:hypothetical protein